MQAEHETYVYPTRDDVVVAASSAVVGGIAGTRVRPSAGWWTPLRVLLVLAGLALLAGYFMRLPCHGGVKYDFSEQYSRVCYSDIPHLYAGRGFADGLLPYIQSRRGVEPLEYPVLTGAFMQIASMLVGHDSPIDIRTQRFFDVNVVMLGGCFLVVVAATALTVRRRPWDAALVALAPAALLTSFINWDLLAVALTSVFMLGWARQRDTSAGVFLGLAVAAKFYPVFLLGPLWLVCRRAGDMDRFWRTFRAASATWFLVNVGTALANFDGWATFYRFSAARGADFGSVWLMSRLWGHGLPGNAETLVPALTFALLCAVIAVIAWRARTPARFAQLAFLVVAAFCLANKVYSPQYVLWLVPLAALARPRWRDFLIWQATQVAYFLSVWLYLEAGTGVAGAKGLPPKWYAAAIAAHLIGTTYFAVLVARDVVLAEHDPLGDERPQSSPITASKHAVVSRISQST